MNGTEAKPGMLSTDDMVAELYRVVCVSRRDNPCLIDQVNSHDNWIKTHERADAAKAQEKPTLAARLAFVFLASIVSVTGTAFVGTVGWGVVTVFRRALGQP